MSLHLLRANRLEVQGIQAHIAEWINTAWHGLQNTGDAPPHFMWPQVLEFAQKSAITLCSLPTEELDDYAVAYTRASTSHCALEPATKEQALDCWDESGSIQTPPQILPDHGRRTEPQSNKQRKRNRDAEKFEREQEQKEPERKRIRRDVQTTACGGNSRRPDITAVRRRSQRNAATKDMSERTRAESSSENRFRDEEDLAPIKPESTTQTIIAPDSVQKGRDSINAALASRSTTHCRKSRVRA